MDFKAYLKELSVHPPNEPAVAFFDLDRTLIAGYSLVGFVFEQFRSGLLKPGKLARQGLNYLRFAREQIGLEELINDAAAAFAGQRVSDADAFAERVFAQHLEPMIYREARRLVEAHRALGHRLAIVSSATRFQALPVARALGIGQVFSTRLEARDGQLTGRIAGYACVGPRKLLAARGAAKRAGIPLEACWFYSDAAEDLPLLERVGRPVVVNAQPALAAHAEQAGWTSLRFTSRLEPTVEGAMRTGFAAQALLASAAAGAAEWVGSRSPARARNSMARVLGELGTAAAGVDLVVRGRDYLKAARPAVFVFNHQSYLDALVLVRLLGHDVAAFCKRELADAPVIGSFMRAAGAIFVERDDAEAARESFREGLAALREGRSVALAPEGTRSTDGQLLPFRPGAFLLARKAGVPVVPLVLHNTAESMPKGSLVMQPATVRVTVLPPIDVREWSGRGMAAGLRALEDRYRELLAG
jgi:putative phosphoserine phosphatase/1-acylglycerol-3-phosphate O-acyltransferase